MTPEESTVGSADSATMVDHKRVGDRLRKELHAITDDRDTLREELQSAKNEISRLEAELLAAKAANAELLEKVGLREQEGITAAGDDAQESLEGNIDGNADDDGAEELDVEEESSQGTESSGDDSILPSTDDDIRLRAARTLIWADSAIKRNTPRSSTKSICSVECPSGLVPETVHVQSNHLETPPTEGGVSSSSCCSTGSQSSIGRPSRDGYDNESLLSIPESEDFSRPSKGGPFSGIRQFLEESMEEKTPDNPPVSSYKYCNEAFKKLNDKKMTNCRTPETKADSVSREEKVKPYCNEAFMRLNERKSVGTFTIPKLFS